MCFAPQRRALFAHLKFQKCSAPGVLCRFWLGNVLGATAACTFSASQLPKVVRAWCVLYILTWKCASRHNGVHYFDISTSKSDPILVCFIHFDLEMCFVPQRGALFWQLIWPNGSAPAFFSTFRSHKSPEKHRKSRPFFLFAHLHLLSLTLSSDSFSSLSLLWSSLFFSSLLVSSRLFSSLLFSSLTFSSLTLPTSAFPSDSSHLCFSICPYCRKFNF